MCLCRVLAAAAVRSGWDAFSSQKTQVFKDWKSFVKKLHSSSLQKLKENIKTFHEKSGWNYVVADNGQGKRRGGLAMGRKKPLRDRLGCFGGAFWNPANRLLPAHCW